MIQNLILQLAFILVKKSLFVFSFTILINNSLYLGRTFREKYAPEGFLTGSTTFQELKAPISGLLGVATGLLGLTCSFLGFLGFLCNNCKILVWCQLGLSLFVLEKACMVFVDNISSINILYVQYNYIWSKYSGYSMPISINVALVWVNIFASLFLGKIFDSNRHYMVCNNLLLLGHRPGP